MKAKERLVCIANIETNEVLRIPQSQAYLKVKEENSNWFFTTKEQYKLYCEGFNPKFTRTIEVNGKNTLIPKNVFIGIPSIRKIVRGTENKTNSTKCAKGQHVHYYSYDLEGNKVEILNETKYIRHK